MQNTQNPDKSKNNCYRNQSGDRAVFQITRTKWVAIVRISITSWSGNFKHHEEILPNWTYRYCTVRNSRLSWSGFAWVQKGQSCQQDLYMCVKIYRSFVSLPTRLHENLSQCFARCFQKFYYESGSDTQVEFLQLHYFRQKGRLHLPSSAQKYHPLSFRLHLFFWDVRLFSPLVFNIMPISLSLRINQTARDESNGCWKGGMLFMGG